MFWKYISILLASTFVACAEKPSEEGGLNGDQEPQPPVASTEWNDVSDQFGELPSYIKVMKSPSRLQGKKAIAYIAVADMNEAEWDVWSINDPLLEGSSDSFKTPSMVYGETSCPIVINAGFFYASGGKNYSASLAVRDSKVLACNINYASEDWKTIYYPTRAALIMNEAGDFDACWTYKTWNNHYMYPTPALNNWIKTPAPTPTADYPEGGQELVAKTAIGGGPLLIDKGEFKNTYIAELYNGDSGIGPTSNQPRTAIGVTADKKMILFVCEGRKMTAGVSGLTTEDVANVLLELGCVEAINLDGGGSSCMLVNGKETIKVSDGSQRAVGSTIMLK